MSCLETLVRKADPPPSDAAFNALVWRYVTSLVQKRTKLGSILQFNIYVISLSFLPSLIISLVIGKWLSAGSVKCSSH